MSPLDSGTYYVNVEADSIIVDFRAGGIWDSVIFNGLCIDSLDDDSDYPLLNVSIDTDMVGWNSSRLSFDQDTVQMLLHEA